MLTDSISGQLSDERKNSVETLGWAGSQKNIFIFCTAPERYSLSLPQI